MTKLNLGSGTFNSPEMSLPSTRSRAAERSRSERSPSLGMSPQAVSNQLQRLVDKGIIAARRDGTRIFYRVVDPCVSGLLELGICLVEETSATQRRAEEQPRVAVGRRRSR